MSIILILKTSQTKRSYKNASSVLPAKGTVEKRDPGPLEPPGNLGPPGPRDPRDPLMPQYLMENLLYRLNLRTNTPSETLTLKHKRKTCSSNYII